MKKGKNVFLKKLTVVYIKKSLTLRYTAQTLNLFNSLIFQCGINPLFFLLRILSIFLIHTHGEKGEGSLKKLTVVYI